MDKRIFLIFSLLVGMISWIKGIITWMGYVNIFWTIILIVILFGMFSSLHFIDNLIKIKATHEEDYLINAVISIISIMISIILPIFPPNLTVMVFLILGFFAIGVTLNMLFIKYNLEKKETQISDKIFLISFSILFLLAFLTGDLILFLLFCGTGILYLIKFNEEYHVWQKFDKQQQQMFKIAFGFLIVIIVIGIFVNLLFM